MVSARTPYQTRIIFLYTETSNWAWDPVAKSYCWHRFCAHQPDLNFDNPRVVAEALKVMRFTAIRSSWHAQLPDNLPELLTLTTRNGKVGTALAGREGRQFQNGVLPLWLALQH